MANILTAATIAALALLTTPVSAQQAPSKKGIVVYPTTPTERWIEIISKDLDNHLNRNTGFLRDFRSSGIVQVAFRCDERGRPSDIKIHRSAGDASVRSMARNAVRRISTMHPLPYGITSDQIYLANIVVGNSEKHVKELQAKLAQMEQERLASSGKERKYLALR